METPDVTYGKTVWDAVVNNKTESLPMQPADTVCGSLASYMSNFNSISAPPAEDVSKLISWLDSTYSKEPAGEATVARFISCLWWKFDFKGRQFNAIIRNYMKNHPDSKAAGRLSFYRKIDK